MSRQSKSAAYRVVSTRRGVPQCQILSFRNSGTHIDRSRCLSLLQERQRGDKASEVQSCVVVIPTYVITWQSTQHPYCKLEEAFVSDGPARIGLGKSLVEEGDLEEVSLSSKPEQVALQKFELCVRVVRCPSRHWLTEHDSIDRVKVEYGWVAMNGRETTMNCFLLLKQVNPPPRCPPYLQFIRCSRCRHRSASLIV